MLDCPSFQTPLKELDMARIVERDIDPILATAADWSAKCLIQGESLLWPGSQVWSLANLQRFKSSFIDKPDTAKDKSFGTKFEEQLAGETDDVTRLACELLLVYFQFPSEGSVGAARKKRLILDVAGWKGLKPDEKVAYLDRFNQGIGNPGLVYNTGRPNELTFLARFAIAIAQLEPAERAALLGDHRQTRALLDKLAEAHREEFSRPPQLRHIILYLLYPDDYERIASEGHKGRICDAFGEVIDGTKPDDIDDQIKAIRAKLQEEMPGEDLDFYWEPLRQCWYSAGDSEAVSPLQALRIKKQIVFYGPPGTGKTYESRELAGALIRQSLLKSWKPQRYFTHLSEVEQLVAARVRSVQFHPGYGYEDFVRGLQLGESGRTEYRDGVLLQLLGQLETEPSELLGVPFVLILDEMNRADLSRVLGECFSLMEERANKIQLAGHDAVPRFVQMPANLHLIGTMNLIDQSLEHVDFALRRRFFWFWRGFSRDDFLTVSEKRWQAQLSAKHFKMPWPKVAPEFELLADRIARLNDDIAVNSYLGPQYQIGHTYFCDVVDFVGLYLAASETKRQRVLFNGRGAALEPMESLWRFAIEPLLSQYLSGVDNAERTNILAQAERALLGAAAS